ncbi:MAG: DNA methyltransferase [Hyphomicrobiales bacterium]
MLLSTTKPGDTVLDLFFGTGTTGLPPRWVTIGIEAREDHAEAALARIDATRRPLPEASSDDQQGAPSRAFPSAR